MLKDKLAPLERAFDSAKHLVEICNGSGTVTPNISWEFQPAGYHYGGAHGGWSVFSEDMNDALEKAYIALHGESDGGNSFLAAMDAQAAQESKVEIVLNGATYKADLSKMTMNSADNEVYTSLLRRRDLREWVTDLMQRAKVTREQVQLLFEQLESTLQSTREDADHASEAASAQNDATGWPICPVCTFVNAEDATACAMGCGYKPPHMEATGRPEQCPACGVIGDPAHPNYDPDASSCFNCGEN